MGTLLGIVLYIAFTVFVVGMAYRVFVYARTPAPLKIPTMPAPTTRTGVVFRMCREVFLFESLFKASKRTWVFGWLFHVGLLLIVLVHLFYFIEPVWFWVYWLMGYSTFFAIIMLIGLVGLLARRFLVDRVRYISAPSDYLMLVFLMAIAGTGLAMRYGLRANIGQVKQFAQGLLNFDLNLLTFNPVLLIHLVLVAVLLLIFPFSKLLHVPGLFFSPSRYQVDNSRERRYASRMPEASSSNNSTGVNQGKGSKRKSRG